jgi:hypothetical protein
MEHMSPLDSVFLHVADGTTRSSTSSTTSDTALPSPVSEAEVDNLMGRVVSQPLDRHPTAVRGMDCRGARP